MFKWLLMPKNKNSVQEIEFWTRDDQTIQYTHRWKEGSVTVYTASGTPPDIDLANADEDGLWVTYLADDEAIIEVEINDFSGGETEEWIALSEDMAEDALNDVRDAWDEDWSEGVTQLGWHHESTEVRFYGELILEPVSD